MRKLTELLDEFKLDHSLIDFSRFLIKCSWEIGTLKEGWMIQTFIQSLLSMFLCKAEDHLIGTIAVVDDGLHGFDR